MLCGLTICGGCGKSADESNSVDVEISAGQSDAQSSSDESDNAISNENTSDDGGQKSELATSLAEDADVRKAQEEYMKNIHSEKGKSVVVRMQNENLVLERIQLDLENSQLTKRFFNHLKQFAKNQDRRRSFRKRLRQIHPLRDFGRNKKRTS